ncbi:NAD(P)H-dependent oxidoreductase [Photobacterium lipolyticum]|uniref:NAD(P)H dehydrogenase n=1 Tax=Photobacterium lipolyticum TaxID=266810 RepID=A0A2T3N4Y5_9GAMM|nr:NAD(P)H-dependent oxidoreductase [Photobacterium lipolyticum]PSW07529.1 NAD(P)H dehydrogenase [Photobacterium lipolyticum]
MNVLVIDGHPDLQKSTANAVTYSHYQQTTDWSIQHLGAGYQGDIDQEQSALLNADIVVVQFPLYWSTFPAVLKKWIDDVFTYGFAFGPNGSKLKDKKLVFSITAGATAESYSETGFNFMPFSVYQQAFEHVFRAAEMDITNTIVTFEMNANPDEGGDKDNTIKLAQHHAKEVINTVNTLIGKL